MPQAHSQGQAMGPIATAFVSEYEIDCPAVPRQSEYKPRALADLFRCGYESDTESPSPACVTYTSVRACWRG